MNPKLAVILELIESSTVDCDDEDSVLAVVQENEVLLRIVRAQQEVIEKYSKHAASLSHSNEPLDRLLEELSK